MRPTDHLALADAFERLSDDSRYMRFLAHRDTLTPDELHYLSVVDHYDHEALVAVDAGRIVGVSRYVRDPARPAVGEVSVVVAEDWRRRGLARTLLLRLGDRARAAGIRRFEGSALPHNPPRSSCCAARRVGGARGGRHGAHRTPACHPSASLLA